MRKERKDKEADILVKLRKINDQRRKATVKRHTTEWSDERVAALTNDVEIKSLELQTMQGLVSKVAHFGRELSETRRDRKSWCKAVVIKRSLG